MLKIGAILYNDWTGFSLNSIVNELTIHFPDFTPQTINVSKILDRLMSDRPILSNDLFLKSNYLLFLGTKNTIKFQSYYLNNYAIVNINTGELHL